MAEPDIRLIFMTHVVGSPLVIHQFPKFLLYL